MIKILAIILSVIIGIWTLKLLIGIAGGIIGLLFSVIVILILLYIIKRIWEEID